MVAVVAGVAETKEPEAAMTLVALVTVVAAKMKDLEAAKTKDLATAAAVTLVTASAAVLVGVLISSTIASSANRPRRHRRVSAMTADW